MKKIVIIGVTALLLTACQSKKAEKPTTSSTKTVQKSTKATTDVSNSSMTTGSQASSTTSSSTEEPTKDASYNGSYYTVKSKQGNDIVIVNKKHALSPDYNPGEIPEAKAAFLNLLADMKAQGFALSDNYSGFRSYATQNDLYNSYVARDGQAAADRYSARPGYSEHQTGLAFDLLDASGQLLTEPTASQWLLDHAADYGFIVRYREGKEGTTGYMPESWHVRYIGSEAKEIAASGLTLEEYLGVEGGSY